MSRATSAPSPQLPNSAATIGMWIFLAALFMLFASGMLGYLLIRIQHDRAEPLGSLHFPHALWVSTAIVLGVSATLGRALYSIRRERQSSFRVYLMLSLLLACGFIAVQTPALASLLRQDRALLNKSNGNHLYGLIFVLILLHALHVIGGIIPLIVVNAHGYQGRYDHEHSTPVAHTAMYWHFLDAVWVVMFSTFFFLG